MARENIFSWGQCQSQGMPSRAASSPNFSISSPLLCTLIFNQLGFCAFWKLSYEVPVTENHSIVVFFLLFLERGEGIVRCLDRSLNNYF